jgi:hypothetical protein
LERTLAQKEFEANKQQQLAEVGHKKLEGLKMLLEVYKAEKVGMQEKFGLMEGIMGLVQGGDLNGYKGLIEEMWRNEVDQRRGEFLRQKAIFEEITYEDPYQVLLRKVKTDKIVLNEERLKTDCHGQAVQTEEPLLFDNFTQTSTVHKRARGSNRNHIISQTKVQRVSTIVPQTFRGGGFLYYSRSIDEDEVNSI